MRTVVITSISRLANILGNNQDNVNVLCYHSFTKGKNRFSIGVSEFETQIKKIMQTANFISLDEAVAYTQGKKIKTPAVALTIDDGYADVLNIVPIIEKYHIPVALFVLADPDFANRKELDHDGALLNWKQIKFLENKGWTIGCHSATHADFFSLSADELNKEIIYSKKTLESQLGFSIKYFAYPKGKYNQVIGQLTAKAGYMAAFSVFPDVVSSQQSLYYLPRTIIDATYFAADFPALYSKSTLFIRRILDGAKINRLFLTS